MAFVDTSLTSMNYNYTINHIVTCPFSFSIPQYKPSIFWDIPVNGNPQVLFLQNHQLLPVRIAVYSHDPPRLCNLHLRWLKERDSRRPRVSIVQYNIAQYSIVSYSIVWYSIVKYIKVSYSIVQYSKVQCTIVSFSIVKYIIVSYSIVQYSKVQ